VNGRNGFQSCHRCDQKGALSLYCEAPLLILLGVVGEQSQDDPHQNTENPSSVTDYYDANVLIVGYQRCRWNYALPHEKRCASTVTTLSSQYVCIIQTCCQGCQ
jgi:hypothetical protein